MSASLRLSTLNPSNFCHSERSEESLLLLAPGTQERFLAPLGITKKIRRAGPVSPVTSPPSPVTAFLPLQHIHLIAQQCLPIAEKRDNDPQAHSGFRGSVR